MTRKQLLSNKRSQVVVSLLKSLQFNDLSSWLQAGWHLKVGDHNSTNNLVLKTNFESGVLFRILDVLIYCQRVDIRYLRWRIYTVGLTNNGHGFRRIFSCSYQTGTGHTNPRRLVWCNLTLSDCSDQGSGWGYTIHVVPSLWAKDQKVIRLRVKLLYENLIITTSYQIFHKGSWFLVRAISH